ncbi:hypothetical protein LZG04_33745 [Saccharothrix sp. S26]|nr:hypothetical protein [Saccharothrix sp. S26]MCE6999740.1 hypothetical protein [Saccharothrix sp. S26]
MPVVAVAGRCTVDPDHLGINAAYALLDVEPDLRRRLTAPAPIPRRLGGRIAADRLGE